MPRPRSTFVMTGDAYRTKAGAFSRRILAGLGVPARRHRQHRTPAPAPGREPTSAPVRAGANPGANQRKDGTPCLSKVPLRQPQVRFPDRLLGFAPLAPESANLDWVSSEQIEPGTDHQRRGCDARGQHDTFTRTFLNDLGQSRPQKQPRQAGLDRGIAGRVCGYQPTARTQRGNQGRQPALDGGGVQCRGALRQATRPPTRRATAGPPPPRPPSTCAERTRRDGPRVGREPAPRARSRGPPRLAPTTLRPATTDR